MTIILAQTFGRNYLHEENSLPDGALHYNTTKHMAELDHQLKFENI